MELLTFALVVAAHQLRSYFQAHPIKVLIETPFKKILQWPDTSSRMVNWLVELSEFDIDYLPWSILKGQVLADFVVELANFSEEVQTTFVRNSW